MFDFAVREGFNELYARIENLFYGARDALAFAGTTGWVMVGVALAMLLLLVRRR